MTLKYSQGHWKEYEWVKLSEYYHHEKLDIYHIQSVQENRNVTLCRPAGLSLIIT